MSAGGASEIVKAVVSGVRGGQSGELMNRAPAALGFEVPERAVERIAGGARPAWPFAGLAVETGGELRPQGLDLRP